MLLSTYIKKKQALASPEVQKVQKSTIWPALCWKVFHLRWSRQLFSATYRADGVIATAFKQLETYKKDAEKISGFARKEVVQ